jgi:hypothetical protein
MGRLARHVQGAKQSARRFRRLSAKGDQIAAKFQRGLEEDVPRIEKFGRQVAEAIDTQAALLDGSLADMDANERARADADHARRRFAVKADRAADAMDDLKDEAHEVRKRIDQGTEPLRVGAVLVGGLMSGRRR